MKNLKKRYLIILSCILFILLGLVGLFIYEYIRVKPNDVHFSNVTSNSVTVSWNTDSPVVGTVKVFEGERLIPVSVLDGGSRFFDTRDVKRAELLAVERTSENIMQGDDLTVSSSDFDVDITVVDMGEYYTHHVTVTNLNPETSYSFMVGDRYLFREVQGVDGETVVSTLETPEEIKGPVPAYGTVKDANNINDPIDGLSPVTDAIVYFNYLDENTGKKSNTFSSSLNENGNWYIDLSLATDSEGVSFMESYDTIDGNIYVEILIDAGILGIWKEKQSAYVLTPLPSIILNIPDSIQDSSLDGSLIRLDNPSEEVKGLTMSRLIIEDDESCSCVCPSGYSTVKPYGSYVTGVARCTDTGDGCIPPTCYKATTNTNTDPTPTQSPTTEDCLFKDYCPADVNDCVTEISRKSCRCDQDTLNRRNCSAGTSDPQEDLTCAGGVKQGKAAYDGGKCVVCSYSKNHNYYVPRFIDGSDQYEYDGSSCIPIESNPECGVANGVNHVSSVNTIPNSTLCKGSATAEPSEVTFVDGRDLVSWKCTNSTGYVDCSATRSDVSSQGGKAVCDDKNLFDSCEIREEEDVKVSEINNRVCTKSELTYLYRCLNVGFDCTHWKSDSANFKYYVNTQGQCVRSTQCVSDDYEKVLEFGAYVCRLRKGISDEVKAIKEDLACWEANGVKLRASDGLTYSYSCWDGVWEDRKSNTEDQCQEMVDKGCATCRGPLMACYDSTTGIAYGCWDSGNGYEWGPACEHSFEKEDEVYDINYEEIPVETPKAISVNTQCLNNKGEDCICEGGVDVKVPEGLWCRGVAPRMTNSTYCGSNNSFDGMVCNKFDGTTCIKHPEDPEKFPYYYCYGDPPEVAAEDITQLPDKKNEALISLLKSKEVLAQSVANEQYIIDTQTGVFENISSGSYMFEYNDEYYLFQKSNNGNSLIYLDTNDNQQFDEGIDIKVSDIASEIIIIALERSHLYNLEKGFNFVSFPFLISGEEYRTAAGLLTKLNEVYNDSIYSISKFDGRWKMVGQNVEVYDNNDFQLLPGEGYLIKAKQDIDISIVGQPVQLESTDDNSPIYLSQGWNLIGLYGTGIKTYTAKTLIQDINTNNFTSDNVTKWAKDKQMYEGFQMTDGEEYGFDYPLNQLESYFVRITEGKGNWQPSLGGNN